MNARRLGALLLSVVFVGACSGPGAGGSIGTATAVAPSRAASPTASDVAVELTVYGAASLKSALEAAKAAYKTAAPGVSLTIATDASSTLRTQIEQGAPADVFLSADQTNPTALVVGARFFTSLPEDLQDVLRRAALEMARIERHKSVQDGLECRKRCLDAGGVVHTLSRAESQRFERAALPIRERFAPIFGRELLERIASEAFSASA